LNFPYWTIKTFNLHEAKIKPLKTDMQYPTVKYNSLINCMVNKNA